MSGIHIAGVGVEPPRLRRIGKRMRADQGCGTIASRVTDS
jgi:hypothetical protein